MNENLPEQPETAEQVVPEAQAPSPRLKTRRDCTIFGAALFASVPPAVAFIYLVSSAAYGHISANDVRAALISVLIAAPPAAAIGAGMGFETYRVAARSRLFSEVGCGAWILLGVFLTVWSLLLYLQYRHHRRILRDRERLSAALPILQFLMFGISLVLPPDCIALNAIAAALLADSLLVNVIGYWRDRGELAVPHTHKIQFSLATMMVFVIGFGAWVTILVKLL